MDYSEYLKEYGENVNAATGYIHNGVFTNNRWLLDGCGIPVAASPPSGSAGTALLGINSFFPPSGLSLIHI